MRRFPFPKRMPVALHALRGRPAPPRPGEVIVDGQPAGERVEIQRVLARDGLSWRVLDSRGQVLSVEATATGGVWASCPAPNLPIKAICES
jgi:hypothetical protein